jgi:ADP-heptose:LPS heptosyltransferase
MLETLRQSAGIGLCRWQFRSQKGEITRFSGAVSHAQHTLVIMPLPEFNLHQVSPVIEVLHTMFHERHVTVVTPLHSVELMRMLPQGRFIRIEPAEISLFYLPASSMQNRLPRKDYDLAIDLNLDFLLPSGYICRKSGARIRMGFEVKHAELFSNFVVQTTPAHDRKRAYERLATCLSMF